MAGLFLLYLLSFVKTIEKVNFGNFLYQNVAKFPNLQGCLRTWCPLDLPLDTPENVIKPEKLINIQKGGQAEKIKKKSAKSRGRML